MTWHVRGRPKVHVHDIMISGPAEDPEFRRMMDKGKRLCEWCERERHEFDQCVCIIRQATDKFITADHEAYTRKIGLITMSAHRREHMSETWRESKPL